MVFIPPTGSTGSGASIEVTVVRPGGEPAAGAVVHFQRLDTREANWRTATTDASGNAMLAPVRSGSLYWVAAEQEDPEWSVLGGGGKVYAPQSGSTELEIQLFTPRTVGLVISEAYLNAPPNWETGGTFYEGSKYLEVANNGDELVYLDGMLIGKVYDNWSDNSRYGHSRCEDTVVMRRDSAGVWSRTFWKFPGSGGEHPLAPGQAAVLAVLAADHRQIHPTMLDLSGADFEFVRPGYADNPAAPNMISVGPYSPWEFGSPFFGYNGFWFLSGAGDPESFPIAANPGTMAGQPPMWYRRIPAEILHDVAFIWQDQTGSPLDDPIPCVDPVHPDFDRIPGGFVRSDDLEFSAQRRRITVDGQPRLLDTNTSMIDFVKAPRRPGRLP